MRNTNIYIIIIILAAIAALVIYHYVFSIYEVNFSVTPKNLFSDNQSTVTIAVVPLNSFGWKAPLRSAPSKFEISEGKELVEVVSMDEKNGVLILKAKDQPGKVIVLIKSKKALLPSSVEVEIMPNLAGL